MSLSEPSPPKTVPFSWSLVHLERREAARGRLEPEMSSRAELDRDRHRPGITLEGQLRRVLRRIDGVPLAEDRAKIGAQRDRQGGVLAEQAARSLRGRRFRSRLRRGGRPERGDAENERYESGEATDG
jgi:hypothetical protein